MADSSPVPSPAASRGDLATSPLRELEEPFEDEGDILGSEHSGAPVDEEEQDGEELFGDNMEA
ncbi:DNA helicase, partial [Gryllus bimaculatus]